MTEDPLQELINHIERTGVGASSVLRNRRHELPPGLSSSVIHNWIRERNKGVNKDKVEYLLRIYETLPDNPWVELNEGLLEKLQWKKKFLRGQLHSIYKRNPPDQQVSYQALREILNGNVTRARKLNLDYLLNI